MVLQIFELRSQHTYYLRLDPPALDAVDFLEDDVDFFELDAFAPPFDVLGVGALVTATTFLPLFKCPPFSTQTIRS